MMLYRHNVNIEIWKQNFYICGDEMDINTLFWIIETGTPRQNLPLNMINDKSIIEFIGKMKPK